MEMYSVLVIATVVSSLVYLYYTDKHNKVQLVYNGSSKFNKFVAENCSILLSSYNPPWWASNAHIQILMTLIWPQASVQYSREMIQLKDGGKIALDWSKGTSHLTHNAPIVLVLHGLTGCSKGYRSFCADALLAGYRPVVFNKRGHGGVELSVPLLQAFGCVSDVSTAIAHIEQIYPSAPIVGVGFSAGSGLLCSYLGETGAKSKLRAGVFVSPGYDSVDLFCNGGINPPYNSLLTHSLKSFLRQHEASLSQVIDFQAAMRASSVAEFDRHVYMTLHGYADLDTYWKDNNPMRAVENIAVPVLCINAKDDPVCTYGQINWSIFDMNPNAMLAITNQGSHCGFFHVTSGYQVKSWATTASLDYLKLAIAFNNEQ